MLKIVKIPEARKAILIGTNGETKRLVEKKTKTRITVGEEVSINGDAINVITAENVVKAISRGFSPDKALILCNEEYALGVMTISNDKKELKRIKSRLIGSSGKVRHDTELITETAISIYGKTVSVIGRHADVEIACTTIEKLINGAPHKIVYKYLKGKKGDDSDK
ncbi:MAG: KH domain-containing protein [Candidatus Aenigmatarchaeota archaeon]